MPYGFMSYGMQKRKKWFSLLVIAALLCFPQVRCWNGKGNSSTDDFSARHRRENIAPHAWTEEGCSTVLCLCWYIYYPCPCSVLQEENTTSLPQRFYITHKRADFQGICESESQNGKKEYYIQDTMNSMNFYLKKAPEQY